MAPGNLAGRGEGFVVYGGVKTNDPSEHGKKKKNKEVSLAAMERKAWQVPR